MRSSKLPTSFEPRSSNLDQLSPRAVLYNPFTTFVDARSLHLEYHCTLLHLTVHSSLCQSGENAKESKNKSCIRFNAFLCVGSQEPFLFPSPIPGRAGNTKTITHSCTSKRKASWNPDAISFAVSSGGKAGRKFGGVGRPRVEYGGDSVLCSSPSRIKRM